MDELCERLGDPMTLASCHGRLNWPSRGVYFFFEDGEFRSDSGKGPRVVRVGTHALKSGSSTTLWKRLSQHAGSRRTGGGNHRGSIFRLLIGEALKRRNGQEEPKSWGIGGHPAQAAERLGLTADMVRSIEDPLEAAVSCYMENLPFLFVSVEDDAGPNSLRGMIERNSIALLSNYSREPIDTPSAHWLGGLSGRERVRASGLWNNNHVDEQYDPGFVKILADAVATTRPCRS